MSKQKFFEKLKDPDMAAVRETVVGIVENPKNTIYRVTHEDFSIAANQSKMIIEIIIPYD